MKRIISYLTTPYYGSNRVSRLIRQKIEHLPLIEFIGIPLIGLVFFGAVVLPRVTAGFASTGVYFDTQTAMVNAVVAPSRFRWPLTTFGISQYFSGGHPGMDLTNPAGTPIYPVTDGTVIMVTTLWNGYGRHVIVEHADGMTSIYAHLSKTEVEVGQHVVKNTELGTVGATGWATGNHLHFEITQKGVTLNPMEILPEIQLYRRDIASSRNNEKIKPNFEEIL